MEGRTLINDPYQAAFETVEKARSGPFAWADRLTLETLQQGGVSSHFKPASALNLPFMEKKVDRAQFSNINSLDDLVTASLKGYVPHPHDSKDLHDLFQKATVIAAGSYAPGTKSQYKRAWDRFAKFCGTYCIDPFAATGPEVAVWLVQRSEDTKSAGMVQGDLQAVRCFCRNAGFPMDRIPIVTAVMKGLNKILDTEELNRIGFEPEMIQILLSLALLDKEATNDFVNQRQAALYVIMYWCTARFEEAAALTVGQVVKRGLSLQVNIKKGKKNQEKKLQQCSIHPNSLGSSGNFDPVLIFG